MPTAHLDRAGEPISPEVWRDLFDDRKYRTLARDAVKSPEGHVETTWVGWAFGPPLEPPPPKLFLTEVFAQVPAFGPDGKPVMVDGRQAERRECVGEWWEATEAGANARHEAAMRDAAKLVKAWVKAKKGKAA